MTKPLIIYHGKCPDGFTAAWAARCALGPDCDFYPAFYGKEREVELPDVKGRNIYMLDFCVGEEQLERVIDESESIRVLDHHLTHQEVCGKFECCTFDMERSGAGMAWDILVQKPRPWLIDYIEDRDLWRKRLPDIETVSAYIPTIEYTFENWDRLVATPLEEIVSKGKGALAYRNHYVRDVAKLAMRREFLGHEDIPVVNSPFVGISDLVSHLAKDAKFAAGWWMREDGKFQYSLRSTDFNVSEVARRCGGGGHKNAAGFVSEKMV